MKKQYTTPTIEITLLTNEDIITKSIVLGGYQPGDVETPFKDLLK